MLTLLLFFVLNSICLLASSAGGDSFVGPGQWLVLNILECEDANQYDVLLELSRKKINRTHDGFNFHAKLDRELNAAYGVEMVSKQLVDGGYKYFQSYADPSMCACAKKYAKENFERALMAANIDPPDCPIPAGEITIENFVFNYGDFPQDGVYGTFDTSLYLTYAGRRIGCMRVLVNYDTENGKGSDEDDDK